MEYNNEPSEETKEKWRNDPNNWVWGLLLQSARQKIISAKKNKIHRMDHQFC